MIVLRQRLAVVALSVAACATPSVREKATSNGEQDQRGSLSEREEIKAVLRANLRRIYTCYALESAIDHGTPEGKLLVRFTIVSDGKVSHPEVVRIEGLVPRRLWECTLTVVQEMTFPEPKDGKAIVTAPFTFERPEGAPPWPEGKPAPHPRKFPISIRSF